MTINLTAKDYMGVSFPFEAFVNALDWLIFDAELSDTSATSFIGSQFADDPDDGPSTLTATVSGTGLQYSVIEGATYLVGGTIQDLSFVLDYEWYGTWQIFEMTNANIDGADIVAAVQAEESGQNLQAVENLVMAQSYNAVLGSTADEAGRNYTVGEDGAEWNLRGNDIIRLGGGDDVMFFGDGNDKGYGQTGDDVLLGGRGKDKLYGGVGDDVLKGDRGNDTLYGGDDDDILEGNNNNDRLYGGDGNDDMFGGSGNDRLYNGAGADNFTGGSGADRFQFQKDVDLIDSGVKDRIFDFENGVDRIYLGGIDADTSTSGDDAFAFIGYEDFSGTAGELQIWEDSNGNARVRGDVDGDGQRDFQIYIANNTGVFDAGDFLL